MMFDVSCPIDPVYAGCQELDGFENQDGYINDGQCVVYKGPDADYTGREVCGDSWLCEINIACFPLSQKFCWKFFLFKLSLKKPKINWGKETDRHTYRFIIIFRVKMQTAKISLHQNNNRYLIR